MKYFWVVIAFLGCFYAGVSQQNISDKDIKVGLVLSGGGAKGLAHIGALKVIEESGVKIDYIGGTSMGAIVGALYASGYTASQLDSIFRSVDFDKLIQDNLPRSAKTFYEKEASERYALTLPFNNFKVSIPSAISKGQNIYNLLAKLLNHVNHINDFNKLPTPFFCIATDVESGQPVLLDSGYLPEAIMASGAFPSLFQPVEINNKVLIDGGVVNNYPIGELRDLGANIVIGVDVQDALADRDALKTATGILLQINNYRTVNAMKKKAKQTDIYIKPDISNFTVVSFNDGAQIIENGEKAAREQFAALESLAKNHRAFSSKKPVRIQDSVTISNVSIEGSETHSRAYIRGKLRYDTEKSISFNKLHQGINNLLATNNYEFARYKLRPNANGMQDFTLKVKEASNTMFLRLGAHYDDLYKSAALINLTKKRLLFNDDVASLDFIIGDNVRYNFEYYIDKGFYWSVGLKSRLDEFSHNVNSSLIGEQYNITPNINFVDVDYADITNQLYVQTVLREEFAFGVGFEHKKLKISTETISSQTQQNTTFENSDFLGTYGFLKLDTYDNKYYPKRGLFFDGDFHLYLYSSDYTGEFEEFSIAKGKIGTSIPLFNDKLAINISSEAGFKLGSTELSTLDFFLGGYGNNFTNNFVPFLGYDFLSAAGDSYIKGALRADYEVAKKHHLMFTANYANIADDIFNDGEWVTQPDFSGYGIGYGLETFLGPIEITYSWSPETTTGKWFFNVGFWF
jgi:NTE family protein